MNNSALVNNIMHEYLLEEPQDYTKIYSGPHIPSKYELMVKWFRDHVSWD